MKIAVDITIYTPFETIMRGDTFIFRDNLYMRVFSDNEFGYNSVRLENGFLDYISPEEFVFPVKCKVVGE